MSILEKIDRFQQSHPTVALPFAVIKKYGDDEGAYLVALITYYGFLSLFPLLLVITSLLQIFLAGHPSVASDVSSAVSRYFPMLGSQLQSNVHNATKSGFGLIIGLGFSLLGASGVADAIQHAFNEVWQIPKTRRPGFPGSLVRSLGIVLGGGVGLVATSAVSNFVQNLNHSLPMTILANLVGIALTFGVLMFVFSLATAREVRTGHMLYGALGTAIGFQILQLAGSYLVTHELHNLSSVYGIFAIVLGLLFWIGLQAQIMVLAIEFDTVINQKLWPRSITADEITTEDKVAYSGYPKKEQFLKDQKVKVKF